MTTSIATITITANSTTDAMVASRLSTLPMAPIKCFIGGTRSLALRGLGRTLEGFHDLRSRFAARIQPLGPVGSDLGKGGIQAGMVVGPGLYQMHPKGADFGDRLLLRLVELLTGLAVQRLRDPGQRVLDIRRQCVPGLQPDREGD